MNKVILGLLTVFLIFGVIVYMSKGTIRKNLSRLVPQIKTSPRPTRTSPLPLNSISPDTNTLLASPSPLVPPGAVLPATGL